MHTFSTDIIIEPVDTKMLSDGDILDIADITQDMWAESMKELIRCENCGYIAGKKEALGHLPLGLYKKKVSHILSSVDLSCPSCKSHQIDLIHSVDSTKLLIKERLLGSIESHAVMCKNNQGELVGYAEAYFDHFNGVYMKELAPHYSNISKNEMNSIIESTLDKDVSKMIVLSAFGIIMQYRNPVLFAKLLKRFAESQNFTIPNAPGIIETERNSPICKVFLQLGGLILNDLYPGVHHNNFMSKSYKSILAVFPESMNVFSRQFTKNSVRNILQIG